MATPKKKAAPKKTKPAPKQQSVVTSEVPILVIENDVPIPARGIRDPQFLINLEEILKKIQVKQSFVIPKIKVYAVQKMVKEKFPAMKIRCSIIQPDKKFARVWRMA